MERWTLWLKSYARDNTLSHAIFTILAAGEMNVATAHPPTSATLEMAHRLWDTSFWIISRKKKMKPASSQNYSPAASPVEHGGPIIDAWEAAYLRFETPEQEIQKFASRLLKLGASDWPRDSEIVELFCGRGNGLRALQSLGFTRLEGVDLSPRLVAEYQGPARCQVADCRKLPFANESKDVLIVQGGLHHLPILPQDLDQTFAEMRRVLRKSGRVMFVEPWLTPFLRFVHAVSANPLVRRLSPKMDALETMIENERTTYEQWLGQPEVIKQLARNYFSHVRESFEWGKWNFVGTPR
jgi:ubiquinone/menaquinone biosynthesis C-methylase UbiE